MRKYFNIVKITFYVNSKLNLYIFIDRLKFNLEKILYI